MLTSGDQSVIKMITNWFFQPYESYQMSVKKCTVIQKLFWIFNQQKITGFVINYVLAMLWYTQACKMLVHLKTKEFSRGIQ